MTKEMLINTVQGQECRIAIVNKGLLEELYVERASSASHVGNVYKGRITNVEPSIQAAFVDFGLPKNGFLHISDISPSYFPKAQRSGNEAVGRKRGHRDRPPIQDCLRRGQEVIVQMTKEGIGTKGPTMTTYLSIPGRLLVMMPGMSRLGVSRKIEDDDTRNKARQILADLAPPQDIGFIVRTAAIGHSKRDFQRDLNYLLRLWKSIKKRINSTKGPCEIYQESDLVTRTIRDVYNTDIERIICDNQSVAEKIKEFLDMSMPRTKNDVQFYTGKEGLFHDYGLENEIERIYSRRVELPSGGSLVIDQAEALVAIDVNSGRFREHSDAETNALKLNMEAAKEIARQLRLRDLGGVVIIDFIDMRQEKNARMVEKTLRDEIRNDRAKTKVSKMSGFGIVEMTRQRVRPSLKHSIYRTCWHCEGAGLIKSEESQSLLVTRILQRAASQDDVVQITVTTTPTVEQHLANVQRRQIADIEATWGKRIILKSDSTLPGDEIRVTCLNSRGNEVALEQVMPMTGAKAMIDTVPVVVTLPPEELQEIEEYVAEEEAAEQAELAPVPAPAAEQVSEPVGEQAQEPAAQPAPAKPARGRRRGARKPKAEVVTEQTEQASVSDEAAMEEARQLAKGDDQVATAPQPQPPVAAQAPVKPQAAQPETQAPLAGGEVAGEELGEDGKKKRPRRGRRGGSGRRTKKSEAGTAEAPAPAEAQAPEPAPKAASKAQPQPKPAIQPPAVQQPAPAQASPAGETTPHEEELTADGQPRRRRRGRRGGRKHRRTPTTETTPDATDAVNKEFIPAVEEAAGRRAPEDAIPDEEWE